MILVYPSSYPGWQGASKKYFAKFYACTKHFSVKIGSEDGINNIGK